MNEQTHERKDNNYIPLGINAGSIIIATKQPSTLRIDAALQYLGHPFVSPYPTLSKREGLVGKEGQ